MFLAQISAQWALNSNELSFLAGLVVTFLFFRQYRVYEREIEKQELVDQLLGE